MANTPRKKIGQVTETQVLVHCRRRCCLCVFLEGRMDVRAGQIAHIDRNRSNNKADNLVWLCLEHHNQYDSRTSQTKNLTSDEIKEYRNRLHDLISKQDISFNFLRSEDSDRTKKSEISSGLLIGSIIEAYDSEIAKLEKGDCPNGIKLYNLSRIAATEEGDFFAAKEAFLSLLRIGGERENERKKRNCQRPSLKDPVITANIESSGEKILECFSHTDFMLFLSAIRRARELALMGESSFIDFDPSIAAPTSVFFPLTQILCRLGRKLLRPEEKESAKIIGSAIGDLAMSAAMILTLQDINMPPPPEIIWNGIGANDRVVPEGEDNRLEPFFWAASRIAYLPEPPAYQAALERLKFIMATGNILVDKQEGYDAETSKSLLRKWAAFPGHAFIPIWVKSQKDVKPVERMINDLKMIGNNVAKAAYDFVIKERALVIGHGK